MLAYPGTGGTARVDSPFPHTRGTFMENINKTLKNDEKGEVSSAGEGTSQQACPTKTVESLYKRMEGRKFISEFSDSDDMSVTDISIEGYDSGQSVSASGKRPRLDDDQTADEGSPTPKITTARRGRGRPPITGKYIGVGKARAELAAARREEMEALRREYLERSHEEDLKRQQVAEASVFRQPRRTPTPLKSAEDSTTTELDIRLQTALAKISEVSKVSKGLKGTCTRDLKDAVTEINEVGQALLARTIAEETAKLKRENARLSSQVAELRLELDDLKKELRDERRKMPKESSEPQESQQTLQAVFTRLLTDLEARITARISAVEGIRLRPPLGVGAKEARAAATTSSGAKKSSPTETIAKTGTSAKKAKEKTPKSQKEKAPTANQQSTESGWTTVGAKKQAKKAAKSKKAKAQAKAAKEKAAPKAPKKLRAPKSSAVVITLQPAAQEKGINYAQVLRKAKDKIDLNAIGIAGLRLKLARTGARLLEVPGATSGDKADALASKLKDVFSADEVRVSRPTKRADVRLSGFDDSVGPMEIHEAVVRAGGSSPDSIKVGIIHRRGQNGTGLGSVVVNCPISVAQKLADGRRIYVGWVSVQVKLLPPRPAKCYRCFGDGHVAAQCVSNVDISSKCFRCGIDGHKASQCSAAPHCALCAAAGKPAEHRVGSKPCSPPKPERKGATPSSHVTPAVVTTPTARTTTEGVAMES